MTCLDDLHALRTKYGTSIFDHSLKQLMRERLENYGREKRKKLPPRQKEKLYAKQSGKCAICEQPFAINDLEADHIDPNKQSFNKDNWQLACVKCNRSKGSASVMAQTKMYGKTAEEIIGE